MGYESAPATSLVATACAVCRRPLLDALSVEIGMGPICRERHGYDDEMAELPGCRDAANCIVHKIASLPDDEAVRAEGCAALRLMGFKKLPDRIEYRGKDAPAKAPVVIRLSTRGTGYYVSTPYKPSATADWRLIPGRRWAPDTKENFVPTASRLALWELLRRHFAGCPLRAPLENGIVGNKAVIPGLEAA